MKLFKYLKIKYAYFYTYILDDSKQYTELTHRTRSPPNLETS